MKTLMSIAAAALLALAATAAASAAPNTATVKLTSDAAGTTPTSTAVAGGTIYATFTVSGAIPVVPYEYALQNICSLKGGHFTLGQTDPIQTWTDQAPNGDPKVTVPVYVGATVPSGASCKVDLVRNNTVVKGSVATYSVT